MILNVTIKFQGRTAHIQLGDGSHWTKELPEGQTEEQFCAEIEALLHQTLGDKIKKITTKTVYAQ